MKNNLFLKIIAICTLILIFAPISSYAISAKSFNYIQTENIVDSKSSEGYTNLTIEEVSELISDSSNGIQILIDVRTPIEYITERIYTTSLFEKPRLFPLKMIQRNGLALRIFMNFYKNREVILYCNSANRSFIATKLLIDNGFSGELNNMVGGINEWKESGFPTIKGLFRINS